MNKLTETQERVLVYLLDHVEEHLYQPSIKEISDHFGWASPNAALGHIEALERKGYIGDSRGRSRAIPILNKTPCLRETKGVA